MAFEEISLHIFFLLQATRLLSFQPKILATELQIDLYSIQTVIFSKMSKNLNNCYKQLFRLKCLKTNYKAKGPVKIYRVPRPGFGENLPEKKSSPPLLF